MVVLLETLVAWLVEDVNLLEEVVKSRQAQGMPNWGCGMVT